MNTRELRTRLEKAETQPEIVVRKAEKNLRQAENSQFELRIFRVYQILTSISQQKLNFLKQPPHTTIVDWSSAGVGQSGPDTAGSTRVRLEPSSLEMQTISRLFSASSLAGPARISVVAKSLRYPGSECRFQAAFVPIPNLKSKIVNVGRCLCEITQNNTKKKRLKSVKTPPFKPLQPISDQHPPPPSFTQQLSVLCPRHPSR